MNQKLIRLVATKTKDDEWWSSFVTAPIAIVVNYFVVDVKWLSPNRITWFSFFVAIASAGFIVSGGKNNFIVAALLIHASHVLECMDGQMARYRQSFSRSGNFYDKATDQIQVAIWFGSVAYAAYAQSQNALPLFLAMIGIAFYAWRGYIKYVSIYIETSDDNKYLEKLSETVSLRESEASDAAGSGFNISTFLRWFVNEQKKILLFNEGVFIFMLSLGLITNQLLVMLWIFAISQVIIGLLRVWQQGFQLEHNLQTLIKK
ncbi:MAG: CDP-alcohol phosphatidyltransferase family protein [Chloroflexi bacterium]|nr:CDP-alcohol phosphatidyltransferase family protein [Chloroflexota bacterium]